MPDVSLQPDDFDFEGEMKALTNQANAKTSGNGGGNSARIDRGELLLALGQLIRPLASELEVIRRTNTEQTAMLNALAKIVNTQPANQSALETISSQIHRLGSVESANTKLFDALHAELKGYKDNFLFDTLQKPFIRDLVSLFDDLSAMHAQTRRRLGELNGKAGAAERDFLQTLAGNAENQLHHMIEVFQRMDVILIRTEPGEPVDKKAQRIMSFEPADSEADDGCVARSLRPGFFWRERTIRPEEIVARRWKAPAAPAAPVPASPALPASEEAAIETVLIPPGAV